MRFTDVKWERKKQTITNANKYWKLKMSNTPHKKIGDELMSSGIIRNGKHVQFLILKIR